MSAAKFLHSKNNIYALQKATGAKNKPVRQYRIIPWIKVSECHKNGYQYTSFTDTVNWHAPQHNFTFKKPTIILTLNFPLVIFSTRLQFLCFYET